MKRADCVRGKFASRDFDSSDIAEPVTNAWTLGTLVKDGASISSDGFSDIFGAVYLRE